MAEAGCRQSHYHIASSDDNGARAPRFADNHTETNSMKLAQGKRERKIKVRSARWVWRSKIPRGEMISELRFERGDGSCQIKNTGMRGVVCSG